MPFLDLISDDVINQIIPEDIPTNFKKFVIFHACGLTIEMIANQTHYKSITVNKGLNAVKELFCLNNLSELRLTISTRLIIYNLRR